MTNSGQPGIFYKKMKLFFYTVVSFCILLFASSNVYSQRDSVTTKMSFDLGLTRGNNINLLPLYKRIKTKEKKEIDILFPIYGFKKDYINHNKRSHLFPIYWSDSTATTRDFRFLSLYYPSFIHVSSDKPNASHSVKIIDLAPEINFLEFTKSADGQYVQNNAFFFLWYKNNKIEQKSHLIFFPLYWSFRNKENSSGTFIPFFSAGTISGNHGKYLAVTPLFWHLKEAGRTRNILFPLWWNTKSGSGESTVHNNTLFPIYWSHKDQNENCKVLFPIIWRKTTPEFRSFSVLPIFSNKVSTDRTSGKLMVTPLFWQIKNNNERRDILFPLWFYHKTGSGTGAACSNTIFPLFWSYKGHGNEHTILFPFLWKFKNPLYSSFSVFPIFSKGISSDSSTSHLMVTPLYWNFRDHENYKKILFPIWWKREGGPSENKNYSNVVFPVYWHYRDKYYDNEIIFPFIWSHESPLYSSKTVLPFFSVGSSPDRSSSHLMISPLFWKLKNKGVTWNIFFPIYWLYKDSSERRNVLFPFLWMLKDSSYSSVTLIPLFSTGHSADHKTGYIRITPLFAHFKNHDGYRNVLFPIWWNSKTGNDENTLKSNVIFPIYWSYTDKESRNKIFFPLVWSLKNKNYNSLTVFPLISFGHTPDRQFTHLMILPLFWHLKNLQGYRNVLFPIWWNSKNGSDSNARISNVIFPIYWSFKDNVKNRKVLFPLLWIIKDTAYKTVTIAPLISSGHSADRTTAYNMVTPLFWHFKNPDGYKNILFPIWWNYKKGKDSIAVLSNVIFPVYWSYRDNEKNNKIFFPLVWSLKNKKYTSLTVLPLFSTGHTTGGQFRHLMLTPFFWHLKNKENFSNILFPIFWNSKTGNGENTVFSTVLFPIYYSYKQKNSDTKILFPLIWSLKNKNYNSITVFPLFSSGRTPDDQFVHLVITPLFWHFKNPAGHSNILFPIWWNSKKGIDENAVISNVVFPIYWSRKDKVTSNKIFFPLVWSLKNKNYKSLTVFPLFSSGSTPDNQFRHLVFSPLFWHFRNPDGHRNILFPIWWNSKKGIDENAVISNVVFPIYWSHKDKEVNTKIFFPLVWSLKNKKYTSLTVFPVFSEGHTGDGQFGHLMLTPFFWHLKKGDDFSNILFPIFWNLKTGNGENTVHSTILFPVYFSYKQQNSDTKVLFPLIWSLKNKNYNSFTIIPLFSSGHSPDRQFRHLMITPIFWHFKNEDETKNILFPIYWGSKGGSGDDVRISHILFPVFWSFKNKEANNKILFPVIWKLKNSHYSSFTVFPLLSFGHSFENNSRHFIFTPLFWNLLRPDSRRVTLIPVFSYYNNKSGISDFNVLYFLYHSHEEPGINITDFLMPLCNYEKRINYTYFRFAPFIWYKNSPKDRYFSIQPFFYHSKDSVSENLNIFWQLYSHKNIFNVKKSGNFLWKTIFRDKYTNGDH